MKTPRLLTLAWAVVVILLVIDLIWFPFTRLTFAAGNILRLLWAALSAMVSYAAVAMLSYRLRLGADKLVIGSWMVRLVEGLALLIQAGIFSIALAVGAMTFSYLAASLGPRSSGDH
jgi:hypothetical protein